MTAQFDWSKFQKKKPSKKEKSFDWSQFQQTSPQELEEASPNFMQRTEDKLRRAGQAVKEKPSLLATELPTAALQNLEFLASLSPEAVILRGLGNDSPKLSQILSQRLRQNLPEELQEGAQDIADLEELLLPLDLGLKGLKGLRAGSAATRGEKLAAKVAKRATRQAEKQAEKKLEQVGAEELERAFTYEPEKFASGLSKPRAVDSKLTKYATLGKEAEENAIKNLDREAQELFKKSIQKNLPLSEKIKKGFDFSGDYQKRFGKLEKAAKKFNPEINVSPLREFYYNKINDYKNLRSPHSDAKSIIRELKAYRRDIPKSLEDLLETYRSNNKKLSEIYETRLMRGKRSEYVNFLNDFNRKIRESIKNTLPENSFWYKEFENLNKEFKSYINAQKTLETLEPVLRENLSASSLTRLAEDPSKQKLLKIRMGDKGAEEIIQIAKDLKKAREAIKKISRKDLNKYEAAWPLAWLFKPLAPAMFIKKGVDYGRKGLGHYLAQPGMRKVYEDALEAVIKNDVKAYEKATQKIAKEFSPKLLEYKPSSSG